MSFPSAISSATYGIQNNLQRFEEAAWHIARTPADSATGVADLKMAKHAIFANAAVIRTADELAGTLIDVLA